MFKFSFKYIKRKKKRPEETLMSPPGIEPWRPNYWLEGKLIYISYTITFIRDSFMTLSKHEVTAYTLT